MKYYYLISSLPPLSLGVPPEISFQEFREDLELNLTPRDRERVVRLLRTVDLRNLRALWLGMPLDERGNHSTKEFEEELLVRDELPLFLVEYLESYETTEDRLRYFSSLYASFYREIGAIERGFLKTYFSFERNLRLVLTALRAKKGGRNLIRELQFEDPTDPLVASIFASADALDYTPPKEFEDLKAIFVENSPEPDKLEKALLEFRFRTVEEMEEGSHFGIDQILGYLVRLMMVESWEETRTKRHPEIIYSI